MDLMQCLLLVLPVLALQNLRHLSLHVPSFRPLVLVMFRQMHHLHGPLSPPLMKAGDQVLVKALTTCHYHPGRPIEQNQQLHPDSNLVPPKGTMQ